MRTYTTNLSRAGLLLALSLVGCETATSPPTEGEPQPPAAAVEEAQVDMPPYEAGTPGPVSLRRLTSLQLDGSFRALFGDELAVASLNAPDLVLGGLASVGAGTSTFSPRAVETLEKLTASILTQVLESDVMRPRLMVCEPTSAEDLTCFRNIIARLGERAWRRPLSVEEVNTIAGRVQHAATTLDDLEEGLTLGLSTVLQSPFFLYRVELGEDDPNGDGRRFTSVELASRLSFFLWNAPPDDTLLEAAKADELLSDEGLRAQAERLLADPRAREGFANFVHEYLHLSRLAKSTKDHLQFDRYYETFNADARTEVLKLYDYLVFDADADIRRALTSKVTHLNPSLAALYGLPSPGEEGFKRVTLPEGATRSGILGQAAFLASHSHPVSSSATLRGKAVRTILLCQGIPEPPVDVDTSIPEPSGTTLTLRDRVAEHLENPVCAGCHQLTDPIGLALENYDSVGSWRDRDQGVMIDASGDLDGVEFDGPSGLNRAVAEHPDYIPCFVQMMVRYAVGREETADEVAWLDVLNERMALQGNRVKPLMLEVVMSPFFRRAGSLKGAE